MLKCKVFTLVLGQFFSIIYTTFFVALNAYCSDARIVTLFFQYEPIERFVVLYSRGVYLYCNKTEVKVKIMKVIADNQLYT